MSDTIQRVVSSEQSGRVRSTWRVVLPVLVGLVVYPMTFGITFAMGATYGTAMVVTFVVTALIIVGFVLFTSESLDHPPLAQYGYRLSRGWWLELMIGTGLGGLIGAMTFGFGHALGTLQFGGYGSGLDLTTGLRLGLFLVGFLAVAIWEELVFRGIFITNGIEGLSNRGLSISVAVTGAVILSSLVFTLIHILGGLGSDQSLWLIGLRVALAGGLFAVAYLLSGELALPMGLHLGMNVTIGNVFGIAPMAAQDGVPTILTVQVTEVGLWGPQNGIPVLVSTVIGYGLVVGWVRWRRGDLGLQIDIRGRIGNVAQ